MKTQLYWIERAPTLQDGWTTVGRFELELCEKHADMWRKHKHVTVTPIEKRAKPLWWGDEADGETCENCEGEDHLEHSWKYQQTREVS